jgi:hypothetical protein
MSCAALSPSDSQTERSLPLLCAAGGSDGLLLKKESKASRFRQCAEGLIHPIA